MNTTVAMISEDDPVAIVMMAHMGKAQFMDALSNLMMGVPAIRIKT